MAIIGWTIVATSVLVMDAIGTGNYRDQAVRELESYEARLNDLARERDARAAEARAAQDRFSYALDQISAMQSQLLASETRRRELETGIEVIQSTLRKTMTERERARDRLAQLRAPETRPRAPGRSVRPGRRRSACSPTRSTTWRRIATRAAPRRARRRATPTRSPMSCASWPSAMPRSSTGSTTP